MSAPKALAWTVQKSPASASACRVIMLLSLQATVLGRSEVWSLGYADGQFAVPTSVHNPTIITQH
jgi:hypothetical protein